MTDLTVAESAGIMGRSAAEVKRIRRLDLDDTVRKIASGRRIARGVASG